VLGRAIHIIRIKKFFSEDAVRAVLWQPPCVLRLSVFHGVDQAKDKGSSVVLFGCSVVQNTVTIRKSLE
jgi:phage-related protein